MKKEISEWGILLFLALFVKLLLDQASILNDCYSGDYGVFLQVAQAWKSGLTPYLDIYDNKGPMFYLFYLLGYYIVPGKVGIGILSILNLTVVLKLIVSISRIVLKGVSKTTSYLVVVATLALFTLTFETGHLTEELSLAFVLLPLYLVLRFLNSGESLDRHPLYYSAIYGACFAAIALIRVNNGTLNVGIILGFVILLIKNGHYKALFNNAFYCFLGFVSVVAPFVIYFYLNDALYEMVYANYIYNWIYKDVWHESSFKLIATNFVRLLPCLYLMVLSVFYDRKFKSFYSYFLIPSSIICIYTLLDGAGFLHYFVNIIPFYLLSLLFSYQLFKHRIYICYIVGLLLPYCSNLGYHVYRFCANTGIISGWYGPLADEQDKVMSLIPIADRNSIYSYDSFGNQGGFIRSGVLPIGKYNTLNEKIAKVDTKPKEEMDKFHATTDAKWIVTNYEIENIQSESFKTLIENYDLVYTYITNEQLPVFLYHRK